MVLTDGYRVFHSAIPQYTFFSAAHGTFSKIDYILGHKASLNKCKKIEITLAYCLTQHNKTRIQLKINSRKYSNN
jgi:exonuclease III